MRGFSAAIVALSLIVTGCSDEPAPDYEPGISEQDRATGAEQHPRLLAEFGGEYAGDEQAYLRRLGEKVATSARLDGQCTFTLVNSDVVNAFAVPGCYIYVTRGMMAIVTSEAELASVLGHEIGHIVARHGERQQSWSLWSMLGIIAVSLTGSERLTNLAGAAAQLFTLSYSRGQEYEADELGIRYLRDAGYDPLAAAEMLAALGRQDAFLSASGGRDSARGMPEWTSSHPLTDKRVERADALAQPLRTAGLVENETAYLTAVDGLLYGDDPQQGFVIGRRFAHPVMRIGFEAPQGFTLTNSPRAIALSGPDDVRGEFGGGAIPSGGIEAYARALLSETLGDTQAQVVSRQETRINGLPAIILKVRVAAREGEVPLSVAAYDAGGGNAYHFVMAAPATGGSAMALEQLFRSFRLLNAQEVALLRPRRIHVVTVVPGDTAEGIARRIADGHGRALLDALNGPDAVKPGNRVKIVVPASA